MKKMIVLAAMSLVGFSASAQQFQTVPGAQTLSCYYMVGGGVLGTPALVEFFVNPAVSTPQQILLTHTPGGKLEVIVDYKLRQLTINNFKGSEVMIAKGSFEATALTYGNADVGTYNVAAQCSVK